MPKGTHAPAPALREAGVHAVQVGGEQRRLIATGPRPNLDNRRTIIQGIVRQQSGLYQQFDLLQIAFQPRHFGTRFGGQLLVFGFHKLTSRGELALFLAELFSEADDRCELAMLPAQCGQALRVFDGLGVGQFALDRRGAFYGRGKAIAEAQLSCLRYFCRNRSTRPAVSTSFCLPVKNGWQLEQMSVWISGCVDRVWNVFPHAHRTVVVAYTGWISDFMGGTSTKSSAAGGRLCLFEANH
jgi:hypothetical protein